MNRISDGKKASELEYGEFFTTWVNNKYGYTYKAIANKEEYSDVDVFGTADKEVKLNLQMVTSNGETLKLAKQNSKKIAVGGEFDNMPVDLDGWLKKTITDKNNKNYSKPEELIIIIQGFMPTPSPKEVKNVLSLNPDTRFKGVYYVSLPVLSSTNRNYEKDGYVVVIKDAFL